MVDKPIKPTIDERLGVQEGLEKELEYANEAYGMIGERLEENNKWNKEIRDELGLSNEAFERFENVFSSIHNSLTVYTGILKEMLDVNKDSIEADNRREKLQAVDNDAVTTKAEKSTGIGIIGGAKKAGGLAEEFFGNLFANIFTTGGMLGLGAKVAMGAAGLLKTAGIVGIVAPWISEFVTEVTKELIAQTPFELDSETEASIAKFAGDTAMGAVVGRALFGKKGMIIGALTPMISAGMNKLTDALGVEVDKMTVAGFEFDQKDMENAAALAVAAGATALGPALLGKSGGVIASLARTGLMAGASAIGAPAILAAAGVAAVAAAGYAGIKALERKTARDFEAFEQDINENADKLEKLQPNERMSWQEWFKNVFSMDTDKMGSGSEALDNFHRAMAGMTQGDKTLSDADKTRYLKSFETLAKPLGIDLDDPGAANITASVAEDVAGTLEELGDPRAKAWRAATKKVRTEGHADTVSTQKMLMEKRDAEVETLNMLKDAGVSENVISRQQELVDEANARLREVGVDPTIDTLQSLEARRDQQLNNPLAHPTVAPAEMKNASRVDDVNKAAMEQNNYNITVVDNKKIDARNINVQGGDTAVHNDNRPMVHRGSDQSMGFAY